MVLSARPASTWRGVWPIATNVGTGCDGRAGVARRARPARTAKPCGPDSPTLGSSLREVTSRRRWRLSSPALQGERGISRKTVARGMSDDPAEPVVTAACFFCCRRAMGEAITRHSPRPLSGRDMDFASLGRKSCRGNAKVCPAVIAKCARTVGWAKARQRRAHRVMVGTPSLCPPYGSSSAMAPCCLTSQSIDDRATRD